MALNPDTLTAVIPQFLGSITRQDSYTVDPAHGLYAQNIEYLRGTADLSQASTRVGNAQVAQLPAFDGGGTVLINWYFVTGGSQRSIALYYAAAANLVRGYDQGSAAFTGTLMLTGGVATGAVLVPNGSRLYAAFYDATGRLSNVSGRVYGWGLGDDPLFAAPVINVPVVTQPSTGVITAGVHRIQYLTTTRNGYTGRIQPVDVSGNVVATNFTADGAHNATVTVTFAGLPTYLQAGATALQVVMTTAVNPNRYYTVPGAVVGPLSVGANSVTFSINDDDLAATGIDVTSYINLLASAPNGTPPFLPSSTFSYSSRQGYITMDAAGFPAIYISDPDADQKITADQHLITLEGNAKAVHAVSLHGVLYIGTQFGFYNTNDNGGVPSTWTSPQRVDGSVGVLSPTCLLSNPEAGYILVASDSGLYLFQGGTFPSLPVSYYQQPDWLRINWNAPTQVQVVDDVLNKRFIVQAPLGSNIFSVTNTNPVTITTTLPHLLQTGLNVTINEVLGTTSANGTFNVTVIDFDTFSIPVAGNGTYGGGGVVVPNSPNAELTWDHTEGTAPEQVKFSLNSFTAYRSGAIGVIQNLSTKLQEVWRAPAPNVQGGLIRKRNSNDMTPYRDVDLAGNPAVIGAVYQTSNIPGTQDESMTIHDYHGAHFRVTGNGHLLLGAIGLDGTPSVTPAASPVTLSKTPGKEILVKWFLRSEQQTIQFVSSAIDEYFSMALIRAYYTNAFPQR